MTTKLRIWIAGLMLVAVLSLLLHANASSAEGKKKEVDVAVKEIADELKKGNKAEARKLAEEAAKNIEKIPDMMHLFKNRNKGGLGAGSTPLTNPAKDGIDSMIRELAAKDVTNLAKQVAAFEEMGYHIAAMGELANAAVTKAETGGSGKKSKKAWLDSSEEMRDLGMAFAKAAAGKNAKDIKTAAGKVYSNCNRCHSNFKDN